MRLEISLELPRAVGWEPSFRENVLQLGCKTSTSWDNQILECDDQTSREG